MQKTLHINPDKCTGCLSARWPARSRTTVPMRRPSRASRCSTSTHRRKVPYTCTQCDEAWCLHACPVEAITVDKADRREGRERDHLRGLQGLHHQPALRHHQLRAGNRQGAEVRPVRRRPRAAACPTGAITYVDANWTGLNKMRPGPDKLGNQTAAA